MRRTGDDAEKNQKRAAGFPRQFWGDQSGSALLVVLGLVGVAVAVAALVTAEGTRHASTDSQRALTTASLKTAGGSAIRLLDQYARAGFLRADCASGGLMPSGTAPPAVKKRYANLGFIISGCEPTFPRTTRAASVYRAAGAVPSLSACGALPSRLTFEHIDFATRQIDIHSTSAPSRVNAVTGSADPQTVVARLKLPPPPVPSFGLLVNDLHCGMCHVRVIGDVVSTRAVTTFHYAPGSIWRARVDGSWFAEKTWHPAPDDAVKEVRVDVTGGVFEHYAGTKLPGRFVTGADGAHFKPEFPVLDFGGLAAVKPVDPFACTARPLATLAGNTVLVGKDQAHPIVLNGDLHVKGDLVIKGWYRGVGTIYVDGNVYIPFDVRAVKSIFPYPSDQTAALEKARDSVASGAHDALALATKRSIIIGEFDDNGQKNHSVWYHSLTPPNKRGDVIGVKDIYKWYPEGRTGYEKLFQAAYDCVNETAAGHVGSINMIEAYLYAQNTIGGLARRNSYAINGGIIADNYHVVSAAQKCSTKNFIHPVHQLPVTWSYVNYDWRMRFGLPLLDRFGEYFVAAPN